MERNLDILPTLQETWGFMMPWCQALQHKLQYKSIEYLGVRRYLQVLVPLRGVIEETFSFYDGTDTFQLIREGLALLAAVAHVDYNAWRYLLQEHCAIPLGCEGDELFEDEIPVYFLLTLDRNAARRGWHQPLYKANTPATKEEYANRHYTEDILEFFRQDSHSRAYVNTLDRVSALVDSTKLDIQIPVQVYFEHGYAEMRDLKAIVKAESLLDKEKHRKMDHPAPTEALQCSFVLESTIVYSGKHVDPDLCETMGVFVRDNIYFSRLQLLPCMSGLRDEEFGHLMRLLLNSVEHPSHSRPSFPNRFGRVGFGCFIWEPNCGPEMVLSALAQTRTTNSIHLSLIEDGWDVRYQWWKWIAYGLFSKRALTCSTVQNIVISWINEILPSDMEMFAAVAAAENPEEVLFDSPRGAVESREATLQSGSLLHWQMSTQGEDPPRTLTFEESVPCVWTFSDDGESTWVNAVVPGYGHCLVQRRDLLFSSLPLSDDNTKGIRSLEVTFAAPPDNPELFRFLSVMAPTLRSLTIHNIHEVNMFVECCPYLEELVLMYAWVSVSFDFSEFHEATCPLPTFTLDWVNIPTTLAYFSDPRRILARCLHKLRIFLFPDNPEDEEFSSRSLAAIRALLELLKRNGTLQYLEVVSHPMNCNYKSEFRKFHLQPLAVQENPLSMECKTAFLSAFYSETSRRPKKAKYVEETSPLPSPDNFVVSNIFAFAAEPVKRKVFFTNEWCSAMRFEQRCL